MAPRWSWRIGGFLHASSCCGSVKAELDATGVFEHCGFVADRDWNAAKNLERVAASSAVSTCGEERSGAARKEPNGKALLNCVWIRRAVLVYHRDQGLGVDDLDHQQRVAFTSVHLNRAAETPA